MTTWTVATIVEYAELHGFDLGTQAERGRLMAQKAADAGAALSRDFGREEQPAFAFAPKKSRVLTV